MAFILRYIRCVSILFFFRLGFVIYNTLGYHEVDISVYFIIFRVLWEILKFGHFFRKYIYPSFDSPFCINFFSDSITAAQTKFDRDKVRYIVENYRTAATIIDLADCLLILGKLEVN